jgi:hypothetical protein
MQLTRSFRSNIASIPRFNPELADMSTTGRLRFAEQGLEKSKVNAKL